MGLYDDRLADLSEPRRSRGVRTASPVVKSAGVQSLLFNRSEWTSAKATAWAKSHGYRYGKVDVTDQYIRIRQFDPKGSKVKRTIPFGSRGIRAVIVREESMAKVASSRRRRTKKKAVARKSPRKRARRRSRKVAAVAVRAPRRRKRRAAKVTVRRRKRRVAAVMEAPRKRRRKSRRRVSHVKAWRGDSAGHAKAARKGARRRKARKTTRKRGRRRSRRVSEATTVMAPRRRRRSKRRSKRVMESPRRRRYGRRMRASGGGRGMQATELALAVFSGGLGFVLADGLDRFLATYNPGASQQLPADKFTSTGAGTLANTLNVASKPSLVRLGASAGAVVVPVLGAMAAKKHPMIRSSLEGMAVGTGVSFFRLLWNNLLMPLLAPKDTSVGSLQKSYIARLYPAEVAASINMAAHQTSVSSAGSGALSAPPALGVGADVGPFALAADSPYPDAAQALRRNAGLQDYPSLQNVWGTGDDSRYPTAAQALRAATGMSAPGPTPTGGNDPGWQPGPPPGMGPGPQAKPHADCGCVGENNPFLGFIGDATEKDTLYGT